ncbi:MAG: hypothetical protein JO217_00600 [Acidobacteriaceae bacterium]|nr:hypothetical protein [Acidobacteriaceae bacterium]MBV9441167.1 hypothetical protein [Acidobacteriaceae bacterium]
MIDPPEIPGAASVVAWFGYWPRFHDAEVLSITLNRSGPSRVRLHAWERTNEVDERGYYILRKHAIFTFELEGFPLDHEGITRVRLEWFNHQNVLMNAFVTQVPEGYQLELEGIFGVSASFVCEKLSVSLEPGIPAGSNYAHDLREAT